MIYFTSEKMDNEELVLATNRLMKQLAHKTDLSNRIQTMRLHPFVFLPERMRTACDRSGANGKSPRKGKRIPLNEINYNEQRDALRLNPPSGGLCGARLTSPQDLLTGYGYFPHQARQTSTGHVPLLCPCQRPTISLPTPPRGDMAGRSSGWKTPI